VGFIGDALGGLGSAIGGLLAPNYDDQVNQLLQQELGEYSPGSQAYNTAQISANPQIQAAQMAALSQLGGLANTSGLDPQAQAMLSQALTQQNINQRGQQGAILQNAQQRGVGGSGLELQNALGAQQSGSQAGALAAQQAAASARERALQALGQYGQYATGLQQQGLGTQQQNFMNQMGLSGARNTARGGMQNYYTNKGNRAQQQWGNFGGAIGELGGAAATGGLGGMGGGVGMMGGSGPEMPEWEKPGGGYYGGY